MASKRSKRGRKLRAIKVARYGEKELIRLKNMLAKAAEDEKESQLKSIQATESSSNDVQMDDASNADPSANQQLPSKPPKYPSWLSQFKIKKLAKQDRKCKRKEMKRLKKEKKKLNRSSRKNKNK